MKIEINISKSDTYKILDSLSINDIEQYVRMKKLDNINNPTPISVYLNDDDDYDDDIFGCFNL